MTKDLVTLDHRAVVGCVLTTLNSRLVRQLREHPDNNTLAATLLSIERNLRTLLVLPTRRGAAMLVTPPRPGAIKVVVEHAHPTFAKSSTVEAYHAATRRWYEATILACPRDGYRIAWSDGVKTKVAPNEVRARPH